MMKFTWVQQEDSEIVLNERHIESITKVGLHGYDIKMMNGSKFLVKRDPYLDALFK